MCLQVQGYICLVRFQIAQSLYLLYKILGSVNIPCNHFIYLTTRLHNIIQHLVESVPAREAFGFRQQLHCLWRVYEAHLISLSWKAKHGSWVCQHEVSIQITQFLPDINELRPLLCNIIRHVRKQRKFRTVPLDPSTIESLCPQCSQDTLLFPESYESRWWPRQRETPSAGILFKSFYPE